MVEDQMKRALRFLIKVSNNKIYMSNFTIEELFTDLGLESFEEALGNKIRTGEIAALD